VIAVKLAQEAPFLDGEVGRDFALWGGAIFVLAGLIVDFGCSYGVASGRSWKIRRFIL
jgi:hypothetical protein